MAVDKNSLNEPKMGDDILSLSLDDIIKRSKANKPNSNGRVKGGVGNGRKGGAKSGFGGGKKIGARGGLGAGRGGKKVGKENGGDRMTKQNAKFSKESHFRGVDPLRRTKQGGTKKSSQRVYDYFQQHFTSETNKSEFSLPLQFID